MAKYKLVGLPVEHKGGVELVSMRIAVSKEIDVKTLAEIQAQYDAWFVELSGEGKPCYRLGVVKMSRSRNLPGFGEACRNNGPLDQRVNIKTALDADK